MVGKIRFQHTKASSFLQAASLTKLKDCPHIFLIYGPWVQIDKIDGIGSVKRA